MFYPESVFQSIVSELVASGMSRESAIEEARRMMEEDEREYQEWLDRALAGWEAEWTYEEPSGDYTIKPLGSK